LSGLAHRHGGHDLRLLLMTDSLRRQLAVGAPKTRPPGRVLAPMRYRHPGDAIRLVAEVIVVVLATRPGRRWTRKQLIPEGGAVH
jgi:hypothetical protein